MRAGFKEVLVCLLFRNLFQYGIYGPQALAIPAGAIWFTGVLLRNVTAVHGRKGWRRITEQPTGCFCSHYIVVAMFACSSEALFEGRAADWARSSRMCYRNRFKMERNIGAVFRGALHTQICKSAAIGFSMSLSVSFTKRKRSIPS